MSKYFVCFFLFITFSSCTDVNINDSFRKDIKNATLPVRSLGYEAGKKRFDRILGRLDSLDIHIYDLLHEYSKFRDSLYVDESIYESNTYEDILLKYADFSARYGLEYDDPVFMAKIVIYESGLSYEFQSYSSAKSRKEKQ